MSPRKTEYFPFAGGLNLETPALSIRKGELIGCQNYEAALEGGYRRIDGFERFDGHPLASEGVYHIVPFVSGEHPVQAGDQIVGGISGAVGVIADIVIESGGWPTNNAIGYFVVYVSSGAFVSDELLTIYTSAAFSSGFNSGFF